MDAWEDPVPIIRYRVEDHSLMDVPRSRSPQLLTATIKRRPRNSHVPVDGHQAVGLHLHVTPRARLSHQRQIRPVVVIANADESLLVAAPFPPDSRYQDTH